MPGSQSLIGGGDLPGLTLQAWAQISGGGTFRKGFNVASVTSGGTGIVTLNYSTPIPVAQVVVRLLPLHGKWDFVPSGMLTTSTTIRTRFDGVDTWLPGEFWVGIYS
ncbi:hypothetical protein [Roseateles violae]|uniref:Uncharacterized protein n=1 Tax=Roseateles violae TaxID=3058042 RepID=A0ABT8E0D9_9BURK|nr:hypothetical protein [Pelomonas sp. PFR6]MDN3923331.1 hypothetical protein [Pelomonas sp. PFR6]